jgi:hypothetical protein
MPTVNKVWAKILLTGGSSSALDSISQASLTDNDFGIVNLDFFNQSYLYRYDSISAESEDSPYVIKPDDAGGTGRWILQQPFGANGENLLINGEWQVNQPGYNYSSNIAAGNYFVDGWFNENGASSHAMQVDATSGGIIPGATDGICQLYSQRTFSGAVQISGVAQGETLTCTVEFSDPSGGPSASLSTGYGSSSGAALTLVAAGTLTTTSPSVQFTADYGGSASNYLAINIRSASGLNAIKVERGASSSTIQRVPFPIHLGICEHFYRTTYNHGVAPGTVTNTGTVSFRNNTGASGSTFRGLPSKGSKMASDPTVTIYSPNSGNSGNVYNLTTAADVAVSSVSDLGANGFASMTLGAAIASGDRIRYHAVLDSRL